MSLPISIENAKKAKFWLEENFGSEISSAVQDTVFDEKHLYAIACQETAYFWLKYIDTLSADEILARCVLDASGDARRSSRSAFPKNTMAFRRYYGEEKTQLLINEANLSRRLRGKGDKKWVYKGYGIFQYDLQYVKNDPSFFFEKEWYSFEKCIEKVMMELKTKWEIYNDDIWLTIERYNGQGKRAREYRKNVKQYYESFNL